jgi:hypothetical protein
MSIGVPEPNLDVAIPSAVVVFGSGLPMTSELSELEETQGDLERERLELQAPLVCR